jgi:hypothetical protein
LSASSSTEHREDRRALTRDCRGVLLARFFLPPPPRTSQAWRIRPADMWTPPQHGSFSTLLIGTDFAAVAWLLRSNPGRGPRWAIKAKVVAPPRLTMHGRCCAPWILRPAVAPSSAAAVTSLASHHGAIARALSIPNQADSIRASPGTWRVFKGYARAVCVGVVGNFSPQLTRCRRFAWCRGPLFGRCLCLR